MSTGALMFVVPYFRVTPAEVLEAFVVGMFFSIFLIKTSRFEVRDGNVYLKRSKAFPFILIGLLLIRLLMKVVLSSSIQIGQLSGMFFLLAFGMILPWRVAMYIQYRRLIQELDEGVMLEKHHSLLPNDVFSFTSRSCFFLRKQMLVAAVIDVQLL